MGNQMSVPQRVEDQENDPEADTHKVTPGDACGQNGLPVITSARTVQLYDEGECPGGLLVLRRSLSQILAESPSGARNPPCLLIMPGLLRSDWGGLSVSSHSGERKDACGLLDLGISIQEDNVAASSPKTMETSAAAEANGESLGKDAKPQAPAAKSRFFLTLSRPVPGRTGDQATDSSSGSVRLDVSSDKAPGNKDPSEPMALPVAAAPGHGPDKTPGQTPAQAEGLPAAPGPEHPPSESGAVTPAKPKDSSFFDKLFKLDKGRDKAPVDLPQEAESTEHPHPAAETPGLSTQSEDGPAERDLVDGKGKGGQEVPTVSRSVPGDPEQLEIAKEDAQAENSSIMSFFKTLVSPNKAETKKDPEDTASKGESVSDGQAGQKTSEVQAKGAKKKHLHSPRLGLAFRKFFRHKGEEKSAAPSANLKSDKANITLQEPQGAAKNSTPTETAKDGAKEKGGPSSLPLGKLFWKKSVKEDSVPTGAEENVVCESPVEAVKSEEVESALQTADLGEEAERTPEPAEETPRREERKASRPSLMALLRQMSVKGDGGITHSEEINAKDSSYQTSDPTEKVVAPPQPEAAAAGQKGKEGPSKGKKAAAETNKQKGDKQEAKEPAPGVEPAAAEANSLPNGDKPQKRPEKRRQSLGGFFKGLGPKRMLDAEVQTDPVSIGPAGKSK
ncbi:breast carcinoma-amplified sequence 1 [Bubalus kerabau]|uniref:breast carcinoma-amplified sequence 1 n=1 Tax=Bubalus carabanensis TaxID=3119969 RepID=UPI00244ED03E|nr:breast carcinoma-amplified sequence 1 [Bubalus carabanensis]